jgi:hypothetical protein
MLGGPWPWAMAHLVDPPKLILYSFLLLSVALLCIYTMLYLCANNGTITYTPFARY